MWGGGRHPSPYGLAANDLYQKKLEQLWSEWRDKWHWQQKLQLKTHSVKIEEVLFNVAQVPLLLYEG